jgi:hypothetical protein
MRRSFLLLIAIFAGCLSSQANGDQIYELIFDAPEYIVAAGDTVDVQILLRETVTNGDIARLASGGNDGIFAIGVNLDFSNVVGGPGSEFFGIGDVTFNPQFDDTPTYQADVASSMANLYAATTNFSTGIEVPPVSADVFEVEFATISFTAGVEGSVTNLELGDNDNQALFSLFADGTNLNELVTYGSSSIIVQSVPEPGSMAVLALGGIGLLIRRKRG